MRSIHTVVEGQLDRSAQCEAWILFFKWRPRQSQTLVVECIRVEDVTSIEIIEAAVKLIRTTLRAQINSAARRAPIFRRKLIANHLDLFDSFGRRREALAGGAIVVVVQSVDRNVVRISRSPG